MTAPTISTGIHVQTPKGVSFEPLGGTLSDEGAGLNLLVVIRSWKATFFFVELPRIPV
jgi:hypothetical protein